MEADSARQPFWLSCLIAVSFLGRRGGGSKAGVAYRGIRLGLGLVWG